MNSTTTPRVKIRQHPQRGLIYRNAIPTSQMTPALFAKAMWDFAPEGSTPINFEPGDGIVLVTWQLPDSVKVSRTPRAWFRATAPKRRAPRYQRPPRVLAEDRAYL